MRAPRRTLTALLLACLAYTMLSSVVSPALRTLAKDLGTSLSTATWLLTSTVFVAAVVTPTIGRLGDMFGKKRVLVVTLVVLAVGIVVSATASTVGPMIVGRAIQGVGSGAFPLTFGLARDELPPERVPTAIGLLSAMIGVGAGFGIVLAGVILSGFSYHFLFWITLVVALLAILSVLVWVPETPVRAPGRVDWVGSAGLALWVLALLLGISEGGRWGWGSVRVVGLFVLSAAAAAAWVVFEARSSGPLVDLRTLRRRTVWPSQVAGVLLGGATYAPFVLIPQFVESPSSTGYGFAASVLTGGLYLLPLSLAMIAASYLAGRLSHVFGSKIPLVVGSAISSAAFIVVAVAHDVPLEIYAWMALAGFGIGLAFAAMTNLLVEAVPQDETGVVTGVNQIARSIGGAIGTTMVAAVLSASIGSDGLPSLSGFIVAFFVPAVAFGITALTGAACPRQQTRRSPRVAASPKVEVS